MLLRRGFSKKIIPVQEDLGGGFEEVIYRIYPVD